MEILEIVAVPFPARLLGQHFAVVAAFPAVADGGKILEEEPTTSLKTLAAITAQQT